MTFSKADRGVLGIVSLLELHKLQLQVKKRSQYPFGGT